MSPHRVAIKSLVWATDIDVLASDHRVERRADHWVVSSPSNPTFWWGNFLLFDDAPKPGDGERWRSLFADAFSAHPEITHATLAWDRTDGDVGEAPVELVAAGFELEALVGLTATPMQIRPHTRADREAEVRALNPRTGQDQALWDQVLELQLAQAPGDLGDPYHVEFLSERQRALRERFQAGDGAWYVALLDGVVAASLGIVVTDGRARYQMVDTAAAYRRRGVATRLVADAARHAASQQPIESFVMVADPAYHAIAIYESLGFTRSERVTGALRKPAGH